MDVFEPLPPLSPLPPLPTFSQMPPQLPPGPPTRMPGDLPPPAMTRPRYAPGSGMRPAPSRALPPQASWWQRVKHWFGTTSHGMSPGTKLGLVLVSAFVVIAAIVVVVVLISEQNATSSPAASGGITNVEITNDHGSSFYENVLVPGETVELSCNQSTHGKVSHVSWKLGDQSPTAKPSIGNKFEWTVPQNVYQKASRLEADAHRGNTSSPTDRGYSDASYAIEPLFQPIRGVGADEVTATQGFSTKITFDTQGLEGLRFLYASAATFVLECSNTQDFSGVVIPCEILSAEDNSDLTRRVVTFLAPNNVYSSLYWRYRTTNLVSFYNEDHELSRTSPNSFAVVAAPAGGSGTMRIVAADTGLAFTSGGEYNLTSGLEVVVDFSNGSVTDATNVDDLTLNYTLGSVPGSVSVLNSVTDATFSGQMWTFSLPQLYLMVPGLGPRSVTDVSLTVTPTTGNGAAITSVTWSMVAFLQLPGFQVNGLVLYPERMLGPLNLFETVLVNGIGVKPTLGWTGVTELVEEFKMQITDNENGVSSYDGQALPLIDANTHSVFRFRGLATHDLGLSETGLTFTADKTKASTLTDRYIFLQARVTGQNVSSVVLGRVVAKGTVRCGFRSPFISVMTAYAQGPDRDPPTYMEQPADGGSADKCFEQAGTTRSNIPALLAKQTGPLDTNNVYVFLTRGPPTTGSVNLAGFYYLWQWLGPTEWESGNVPVLKSQVYPNNTTAFYSILPVTNEDELKEIPSPATAAGQGPIVAPLLIDPINTPNAGVYVEDVRLIGCPVRNTLSLATCQADTQSGYNAFVKQQEGELTRGCRPFGTTPLKGYTMWSCNFRKFMDQANGVPMQACPSE